MTEHEPNHGASLQDRSATPRPRTVEPYAAFDPRDLVPVPILCCDANGWIAWLNRAAEELTGHAAHELVGYAFPVLFPAEERPRVARAIARRHLRKEREFVLDAPVATPAGPRVVRLRVRRAENIQGRATYFCTIFDLEDNREEIEELRRHERDLTEQLRRANEAARFSAEILAAADTAMRAPMTGVTAMSRMLLEAGLGSEQHELVQVIESSGRTLLKTFGDLLDLSRMESGRLELDRLDFEVRAAVEAVTQELAPAAQEHGAKLVCRVDHRVPSRVQGDPGRLRQVLARLAGAAIGVSGRSETAVRVELAEETAGDIVLRFTVAGFTPTGTPGEIEALLECFARANTVVSAHTGAEGLGLLTARRLVALMGGECGMESDADGTLACWFRVPLAAAAELPLPEPLPERTLRGLRVLVADPAHATATATAEMLCGCGCVVDIAEDGLEAMDRLRGAAEEGRPYGVAIVDLDLPVLDAESLAGALREEETLASTLLLLFTNLGRPGDAARAVDWGYCAYFVRPVPAWHLHDAMLEVLRRSRTESEPAPSPVAGGRLVTRHTVTEHRRRRLRVLLAGDDDLSKMAVADALCRIGYAPELATEAQAGPAAEGQPLDLVLVDVAGGEAEAERIAAAVRERERPGQRVPIFALVACSAPEERDPRLAEALDGTLVKPTDLGSICALVERCTAAAEPPAAHAEARAA